MRAKLSTSCLVEGCSGEVKQRNLCNRHWRHARIGLIPLPPKLPTDLPRPICSVPLCGITIVARGFCDIHYRRFKKHGDPLAEGTYQKAKGQTCSIADCRKEVRARGLCGMHYERSTLKNPEFHKSLSLRAENGAGTVTDHGYKILTINGKKHREHRWVMEQKLGRSLRRHEEIHHKDGDRLNNKTSNLELWSHSQPPGQRVEDKIVFCKSFLADYGINVATINVSDFLSGASACI